MLLWDGDHTAILKIPTDFPLETRGICGPCGPGKDFLDGNDQKVDTNPDLRGQEKKQRDLALGDSYLSLDTE